MKKLFKILFASILAGAAVFTLVACTDSNEKKLKEAETLLIAEYKDTIGKEGYVVTSDIELVDKLGSALITWDSSDKAVVSNTGKVTPAVDDITITLTATLSIGKDDKLTKEFTFIVSADKLIQAIESLDYHYRSTLALPSYEFIAGGEVILIKKIGDATITWASNDEAAFSLEGAVGSVGQDTIVNVTATLTIAEKTKDRVFGIKVLKDGLKAAFDFVVNTVEKDLPWNGIEKNLNIITSHAEYKEVLIVWTSSDEATLKNDGTIIRPSEFTEGEGTTVTLTVVATLGDRELTKDITVLVKKEPASTIVSNLGELNESHLNQFVRADSLTALYPQAADGFMFTDGIGIIFMYRPATPVVKGKVYNIKALYTQNYNSPQFLGSSAVITASDAPVSAKPAPKAVDFKEYMAALSIPTIDANFKVEVISVRVAVLVVSQENYGTYLVPADYAGTTLPTDVKDYMGVYYKSDLAVVREFAGQIVTLDFIPFSYQTANNYFYGLFYGGAKDIAAEGFATEQARVTVAQNLITSNVANIIFTNRDLTLLNGTAINDVVATYTSSDLTIITNDGKVTLPQATTVVTIDVVLSYGAILDHQFTLTIEVKLIETSTIAETFELATTTQLVIEGIYQGKYEDRNYTIGDTTGSIVFRDGNRIEKDFLENKANFGKSIRLYGTKDEFNGLRQIVLFHIEVIADLPVLANQNITAEAAWDATTLLPHQGKLIDVDNAVITGIDVLIVEGILTITKAFTLKLDVNGKKIDLRYNTNLSLHGENATAEITQLATLVDGDIVSIKGATLGWYNNPQLAISVNTTITK